jgi:hypothetical protein
MGQLAYLVANIGFSPKEHSRLRDGGGCAVSYHVGAKCGYFEK